MGLFLRLTPFAACLFIDEIKSLNNVNTVYQWWKYSVLCYYVKLWQVLESYILIWSRLQQSSNYPSTYFRISAWLQIFINPTPFTISSHIIKLQNRGGPELNASTFSACSSKFCLLAKVMFLNYSICYWGRVCVSSISKIVAVWI